jgi:hypothetical protein
LTAQSSSPVRLLILGAGSRGFTYASYARQYPEQAVVVGVAEPRPAYCQRFAMEASGCGGGDFGLMERFIAAVATGNQSLILSGANKTFESHLTVFAAEQSRLTNSTMEVSL